MRKLNISVHGTVSDVLCRAGVCAGRRNARRHQLGRHRRRIFHGHRFRRFAAWRRAKATAAAAEGLARNPAARPGIQLALILGLALIESLALYTLVIIFAKVEVAVSSK